MIVEPVITEAVVIAAHALMEGKADARQQGIFMTWLLSEACAMQREPMRSAASDLELAHYAGRRAIGIYIHELGAPGALEKGRQHDLDVKARTSNTRPA